MIECSICRASYDVIYEATNQGKECSCFMTKRGIYGAYGSYRFDGNDYEWNYENMPPANIAAMLEAAGDKELVVCDDCVAKLIDDGELYLHDQNRFFG